MSKDIELFSLLAESIDRYVAADVQHHVIVPKADLSTFSRFKSTRRKILCQDDVLPFRALKLPKALGHLSPIISAFRRPWYVGPGFKMMRGWVLQQLLKIEATRASDADLVLHVDSDVFFVKPFSADMAFDGKRPSFFRVPATALSPEHANWTNVADRILSLNSPAEATCPQYRHYVENCIPWSPSIVRDMIARMGQVQDRPWYKILMSEASFSEYFIYGRFVDTLVSLSQLDPRDRTVCKTYWPSDGAFADYQAMASDLPDPYCALAVQSTAETSIADRRQMFEQHGHVSAS